MLNDQCSNRSQVLKYFGGEAQVAHASDALDEDYSASHQLPLLKERHAHACTR